MKAIENMQKHVFVCVNERAEGACCKNAFGMEVFLDLKKFVLENGLAGSVWVTKTGCLGFCNDIGTTIVVYPDKKWFMETTLDDVSKVKDYLLS